MHTTPTAPSARTSRTSPARLAVLALAPAALVAGSLAVTGATGAAAAPTPGTAVPAVDAPQPEKGQGWIEGFVVDRAERSLNDVVVEAYRVGGTEPVATALTYAGSNVYGEEVDGFYRLEVPRGRYRVRFSSLGSAADPVRASWLSNSGNRPVEVAVNDRAAFSQSDTVLTLQRAATVRTTAELSERRVRKGKPVRVAVEVTSPDVVPVTGRVSVTVDGRRAATTRLTARNDGEAVVKLRRLSVGTHQVKVRYLGGEAIKRGETVKLSVTVVRRGR